VSKLSYINYVTGTRESRIHLRVHADPSAPVRVDIMGHGFLDVLNARDISIGGLGILVPHGFAGCDLDSEVELIVTLGRAAPFKTMGSIRHHGKTLRDHLFGVEFTSLSVKQHEAIEAYIHNCLRRASRTMNAVPASVRG
jgi:c-di-GMP-binding flagellar brake protein YcgR